VSEPASDPNSTPQPWAFTGESTPHGGTRGTITLVEGSSFCISERSGDVLTGEPEGLIFQDTRFLSRLQLRLDGEHPLALAASVVDPFTCRFLLRGRPRAGEADSSILVHRTRAVGRGMREEVVVQNVGLEPVRCRLDVVVDADFASVFAVKEDRGLPDPETVLRDADDHELRFANGRGRSVRVTFSQPVSGVALGTDGSTAIFVLTVPPRESWPLCIQVTTRIENQEIQPRHLCGEPLHTSAPVERIQRWRQAVPQVDTNHAGLRALAAQSADDLGALRIFDPEHPERAVVAAGAPWFMTLFGRDSLITSWMALLVDPDLALGVLQTLARFQGTDVDLATEEEPGRILHEMRFGEAATLSFGGGSIYYGSVDATPLFVMLLGELRRWGLARETVEELLPHAERAMAWIETFGDRDGDGFVEYQRQSPHGLENQGWKDSWDAIRFADGELARAPIALCEVQGYVHCAYLAMAHFAAEAGQVEPAQRYFDKAAALRTAFNRDFWLEDRGWFAMALDRDKRPVDALASNMGHCLWTGIVDEDKAGLVAKRLASRDLYSGWGVRTLAASMPAYNPVSYHNGSVWPHDSTIVAAGLMRYGYVEESHRVMRGLALAGMAQGGRLPELFAGLGRNDFPEPVGYPTSCSPQAWAAASPLLMLRSLLRLDPCVPEGKVWVAPELPPEMTHLRVDRIPLAGGRLSIAIDASGVTIDGLPDGLTAIRAPRAPLTATAVRAPGG
jgi:glycogen debranching enzyme